MANVIVGDDQLQHLKLSREIIYDRWRTICVPAECVDYMDTNS